MKGIEYHDGPDGCLPTLESMLPHLSDGELDSIVLDAIEALRDARTTPAAAVPHVMADLRAALTSGRLTDSLARTVRVALRENQN